MFDNNLSKYLDLIVTRMHCSRMRTGRSLTVCGGCLLLGGVCSWGVSALLGVSSLGGGLLLGVSALGGCLLLGRCLLLGGVSQHALRQTPPLPAVDRILDTRF